MMPPHNDEMADDYTLPSPQPSPSLQQTELAALLAVLPPRLAARLFTVRRHKCSSPASAGHTPKSPVQYHHHLLHNHSHHHRRRSALDLRREKLAARSAHAELVRTRAAAERARAAGDLSARVDRALRVHSAREQHLRNVAAAAAAEVRRAKRVAREARERDLETARKVRETAEERIAKAAERRQRLLFRHASGSAPGCGSAGAADAVVPGQVDQHQCQEDAAMTIQRAWRKHRFRLAVRQWQSLRFTGEAARKSSFEELTARMKDQALLDSLHRLLTVFGALVPPKETRTILCSYLLLEHAGEVLSFWGAIEKELVELAGKIVLAIDTLTTTGFSHMVADFLRVFERWKDQDSSLMVAGLVASFVELDGIWQMVKDDVLGGVANEYGEGVRLNQTLILRQLGQLVGTQKAHEMLRDAVRERRRQDRLKKPRIAKTGLEGGVAAHNLRAGLTPNVRGPALSPGVGTAVPAGSLDPTSSFLEPSSSRWAEGARDDAAIASPPNPAISAAATPQVPLFALLPDNRTLVHELALNPGYRLQIPPGSARHALHEALAVGMTHTRSPEEQQYWIFALAEHIRVRLMSLLEGPSSLATEIEGLLSFESVKAALDSGSYSSSLFFDAVAGLLPRLCAPFRDETIAEMGAFLRDARNSDADKIKNFLGVVDLLTLDHANFLLSQAAPILLRHGRDYETRAFGEIVDRSGGELPKLKRIWESIREPMAADQARRDAEQLGLGLGLESASGAAADIPANRVYAKMISSFVRLSPIDEGQDVPETLELDTARLAKLSRDVALTVAVGAILLSGKNVLRRDVRENWVVQCGRIWGVLAGAVEELDELEGGGGVVVAGTRDAGEGVGENNGHSSRRTRPPGLNLDELTRSVIGVLTLTHPMPATSVDLLSNVVKRILACTIGLHDRNGGATGPTSPSPPNDPVVKLLLGRLRTVVHNQLPAFKECVLPASPGPSPASSVMGAPGAPVPVRMATGRTASDGRAPGGSQSSTLSGRHSAITPSSVTAPSPATSAAAPPSPALVSALTGLGLGELANKVDQLVFKVLDPVVRLDWQWRRRWYEGLS